MVTFLVLTMFTVIVWVGLIMNSAVGLASEGCVYVEFPWGTIADCSQVTLVSKLVVVVSFGPIVNIPAFRL